VSFFQAFFINLQAFMVVFTPVCRSLCTFLASLAVFMYFGICESLHATATRGPPLGRQLPCGIGASVFWLSVLGSMCRCGKTIGAGGLRLGVRLDESVVQCM